MPKLRLSLCRNSGKARGKIQSGILVEPSFDAIATAAKNKLRLSAKELKTIRLFNQKTGVEFIRGGEPPVFFGFGCVCRLFVLD